MSATQVTPSAFLGGDIHVRMPKKERRGRLSKIAQERIMLFVSPILCLIVWEVLAQAGVLDVRFFPAPTTVISRFGYQLGPHGTLAYDTYVTIRRVLNGFMVGAVPGVVIGLGMGFIRPLRLLVDPVVSLLYPIPKSAIMPLLMLIFGFGETSKWVLVASGVFFPVVMNCMSGVRGIHSVYVDVAKNYGASTWQYLRFVAMPGALPLVLSGLRLGVGQGLIMVVVAELVGAREGLGYMINHAFQLSLVQDMYVGLYVVGVIGLFTSLVLAELEHKLVPWTGRD